MLTSITHGQPSGSYNGVSQDWTSDAVPAVDYYQGRGFVQTLEARVTDFQGTIEFEITLDSGADSSSWAPISTVWLSHLVPNSDDMLESVQGNFVWIRARVKNFAAGTIDLVQIKY
jgi:hypothetical protein